MTEPEVTTKELHEASEAGIELIETYDSALLYEMTCNAIREMARRWSERKVLDPLYRHTIITRLREEVAALENVDVQLKIRRAPVMFVESGVSGMEPRRKRKRKTRPSAVAVATFTMPEE